MGKHLKRQQEKLRLRQAQFDSMPGSKKAYTRPGSLNRHKQGIGNPSVRRGR